VDQFNSVGRRVCVIGAGIAGLVTAKVLRDVSGSSNCSPAITLRTGGEPLKKGRIDP
jgi:glycine/D-amino acid oxidase-like deaminating enzyme